MYTIYDDFNDCHSFSLTCIICHIFRRNIVVKSTRGDFYSLNITAVYNSVYN